MSNSASPEQKSPAPVAPSPRGRVNGDVQASLEKSLANRPSASTLASQGITKTDGTGRHAAAKSSLARALTKHQIQRELNDRSSYDELAQQNILEQSHVAPSLSGVAKALNRALISNSLNQKLYARDGNLLEDNEHIFRGGQVADRLKAPRLALEHAMTRDRIGAALDQRPDVSTLYASNILSAPVASKLAAKQRELSRNFTADRIGHLLEQRSDVATLERDGVLKGVGLAPRLTAAARTLEHNLAKSNLYHALAQRPSIQELAEKQIWRPHPEINYYVDSEDDDDDEDEEDEEGEEAAAREYYYQQQRAAAARGGFLSPSSAANRAANMSYASNPSQSPNTTASIAGIAAAEAAYRYYQEQAHQSSHQQQQQQQYSQQQQAGQYQQQQQQQQQQYYSSNTSSSVRRSKNFHLTRILLKYVAALGESGEITQSEKSFLKELICDQVPEIYAAAEMFDEENDIQTFKQTLIQFAQRR